MKQSVTDKLIVEHVLENQEVYGIDRNEAMTMACRDLSIPFQSVVDAVDRAKL